MPSQTVESAMTPYPYVLEMDSLVLTARTMMQQFKVRHMPVRDGDKVMGVVTEQILKMAEACGKNLSGNDARVRDLYTSHVLLTVPEEPLESVLRKMADQHFEVALVLRQGHLAGIFTTTDACRRYADLLGAAGAQPGKKRSFEP